MRDKKISILLIVSFLLLLASFLILCTWVYNYYSKEKQLAKASVKLQTSASEVTRDSLLKIYTATIQSLESQLGDTWTRTDSLEQNLSLKLDEFYRLKDELATLLKNPSSGDDFRSAKKKITELQQKLEALRYANINVEQENSRLYKLLAQINNDRTSGAQSVQYVENPSLPVPSTNTRPSSQDAVFKPFSTYEISLASVKNEDDDAFSMQKEIIGSFVLTNTINMEHSEVMVVVTQPNGQVLQKSAWESGAFQTNDGKKIYSCKMQFEYAKGEVKKFTFSLNSEKFIRGTYTLQIYHNGVMVGKIAKTLS
jgi:hypothetical protein